MVSSAATAFGVTSRPTSAYTPTTMMMSWSNATMATTPILYSKRMAMYAMISAKDTRSAMRDDWTTLAPQSGPMVDTSNDSADQPNCPATWLATSVAASGEVFDVRTRNP